MNEISNFCNGECNGDSKLRRSVYGLKFDPNNPPYHINNHGNASIALNMKTLDMDVVHYGGILEYNSHNLFGAPVMCVVYVWLNSVKLV